MKAKKQPSKLGKLISKTKAKGHPIDKHFFKKLAAKRVK